ncbi:MAG: hypothetical protein FJ387_15180 [Verrucomicrobia bacterium]|nr:hypothetical protein [Verrucomicrobiota bacterium]
MASFTQRMIGAAALKVPVYEEIERDTTGTGEAAGVVAIVAAASALGGMGQGGAGIIAGIAGAFIGWLVWAAITLWVGTKLFGGMANLGEMLRVLGFAQSIGVIKALAFIPILGPLLGFAGSVWMLVCGVVAVRQALDFTTGKAIGTVLIGWVLMVALRLLLSFVTGGAA